jgi:hypothetical protein
MVTLKFTCPVCGYLDLHEPPRLPSGAGSDEICPSCGFQFGVSDDDEGLSYDQWRSNWVSRGCPWSSRGIQSPPNWNPIVQLASITAQNS